MFAAAFYEITLPFLTSISMGELFQRLGAMKYLSIICREGKYFLNFCSTVTVVGNLLAFAPKIQA